MISLIIIGDLFIAIIERIEHNAWPAKLLCL